MPETLLIVGGTGFIGRRLSECALEHGMDVLVLSLTPPILKNKIESVTYVQSDITDLNEVLSKQPYKHTFIFIKEKVQLEQHVKHVHQKLVKSII